MGRIVKKFAVSRGSHTASGRALIDSGADATVLHKRTAKALGIHSCDMQRTVLTAVGGGEVHGYSAMVKVTVGAREAFVNAFVPTYIVENGHKVRATQENLIGHDFLQKAKAKLDFNRPHSQVLSGTVSLRPHWKMRKATRAEAIEIGKELRCPRKKK